MATNEDLEEELYCPICADVFDDPLMLPCTHSFCRRCLHGQIKKGNITRKYASVLFDCPVCRKEVKLDESGIDTLPRNRLLKKMVDMFQTQTSSSQQFLNRSQNFTEMCELHDKELGAFCSACWDVVCIDCITGDHKGHTIESIDDVVQKQKRSLDRKREELEEERKKLLNTREEEFKFMEQLKEVCNQKSVDIQIQFDEYIGQLKQIKESILGELSARLKKELVTIQDTLDTIDSREDDLDKVIQEITDIIKCDKLKILKESTRLKDKKTTKSTSSLRNDLSPRSRKESSQGLGKCCFSECSLKLDSAALESAINTAHLVWETDVDIFSSKHLSDRFTQMYEKEWKSAYMESSSKDDVVKQMFNIVIDSYRHADLCSETHLESLTYRVLQPDIDVQVGEFNVHGFNDVDPNSSSSTLFCNIKEDLRKLRAKHAPDFMEDIAYMIQQDPPTFSGAASTGASRHLSNFSIKCFELTFALRLQDPPLYIETKDTEKSDGIDKELYKHVKRRGRKSKTIVWPPLYLYKGGPILAKGVVFIPA